MWRQKVPWKDSPHQKGIVILKKKSHSNICQVTMDSDMKWAIVYLRPLLKTSSESANAFQVGLFLLLMYLNNYLNENLMKFRYVFLKDHENMKQSFTFEATKGQLNSEWIYEVIVSPKMPTKNYRDICQLPVQIFVIFGWYFRRMHSEFNWPLER